MKNIYFLLFIATLSLSCQTGKKGIPGNPFQNAQWIGYEQLVDSMEIVPAVHGSGDQLGEKGIKKSVVPLFRKEFNVSDEIKSASINISGLGHYELFINGGKIGDRFLAPGWTLYQKRCLYNTYDITEQIKKGDNVIGVIVGNGFFNVNRERYRKLVVAYGYPRLIFDLRIELKDGSIINIISDNTCKTSPSPVIFSSIYGGEDYDARLEQSGWNEPGFDDSKWQNPVVLVDKMGELMPEKDFPLKVMQEFDPEKIFQSIKGRTIYDFGQNASGIIAFKVKGNKGARIIIRPDEIVNDGGDITQRSGGGPHEYNYILKGEAVEEWQPRFSYYGFRFADIEIIDPPGSTQKTEMLDVKMLHIRNSAPTVGSFNCSDTLFNQIFELINWGIKSNMASVVTDCPHREKLGWLEQTYLMGSSIHYNYDIQSLYNKVVDDMMDSQLENGLIPDIAPEYVHFKNGFRDSPEWGSASVIIPWQMYHWYGDKEVLKRAYPMMKRYVGYLQSQANGHILDYGLGDWYDLGPKYPGEAQLTPKAVTATAIYYYNLKLMAKIGNELGYKNESKAFTDLSIQVKDAYLHKFYDSNSGVLSTGSQTAYAMSLYTGLIPENDFGKVFNNLISSIEENNYALTSGDIGYHFLVRVLSENGRSDILYKMNNRTDVPGYGYQLKKDATALTESWGALAASSNNHLMLGHLMEWFYSGLGGIQQTENSIGYSHVIIAPKPAGAINWVNCSFQTVKGMITSNWHIKENSFYLTIEVPDSAVAKITIPEPYGRISCIVKDLKTNKLLKEKIISNTLDLSSGNYTIVAE